MADNKAAVLTHPRFATTERLKDLADQGLIVIDETRDWTDIDLKEPQYGEEYLGDLTADEKSLFFALYDANNELEDKTRTFMGKQIEKVGKTIAESDRKKTIQEVVQDGQLAFDSDDDADAYFKLQKLAGMLHSTFHWNVAERLNAHAHVLGVRTNGRVYKVERRY